MKYFGGCAHTYLLKTLSAMSGHCNFRVPKKANTCWCRRYQLGNIQLYPGRILFHTSKWNTNITLITGRRSHQSCKSLLGVSFSSAPHQSPGSIPYAQSPTKHFPPNSKFEGCCGNIKFPWISFPTYEKSNLRCNSPPGLVFCSWLCVQPYFSPGM